MKLSKARGSLAAALARTGIVVFRLGCCLGRQDQPVAGHGHGQTYVIFTVGEDAAKQPKGEMTAPPLQSLTQRTLDFSSGWLYHCP